MKRCSVAIISLLVLSGSCSANSLCSPKDNNARILSAPSPNAIDPHWTGDSFVGIGWSFYVTGTVESRTGLFAKGNLHGSRGGITQRDVYILLSEWTCAEAGEEITEDIERVDVDPQTNASTTPPVAASTQQVMLPQTFPVVTEKGRRVWLRVTNFGRIVMLSKRLRSFRGRDSANESIRDYRMTYRFEPPVRRVPKQDGMVVGYEFQLPRIPRGDRLLVNYKVSRPHEVSERGTGWENIDTPWVFDSSYSGAVRTLFTEFRGGQNNENLGEWEVGLVVNGKNLVTRQFELFDPTGRAKTPGLVDVPDSVAPLVGLTGVWAHSSADCKLVNTSALDKMTRVDSKQYQVVGVCGVRFEYLQRAFSCEGSDVKKVGDVLEVETSCRLKDYDPEKKRIHIKVRNPDSVEFLDSEFEITGSYVRCSSTYVCNQF
jgi:hypothetical protein